MKRKGQSILEYVIVLTVIIAAIAIAANKYLKGAMDTSVSNAANAIQAGSAVLPKP